MANVSDFAHQTRGPESQVCGFTYQKAAFADQAVSLAESGAYGELWHDADQAGRLSVRSAGVAIAVASAACWGVLSVIVSVLV
ncbi:hypothetical protein CKO28_13100 [Rhodovibrio sodomensis]|uniref:Uncharacterized protein n=1 Tax=Rhodovibrio sodomensis TaxID=1088 RepID=A0ABS1DFF8_9PROT|nr:hypothetical protein [Rhodovibrio sodomensis]MBK1668969.1 hypothetical protein [Rhodovibrio sodomensis]